MISAHSAVSQEVHLSLVDASPDHSVRKFAVSKVHEPAKTATFGSVTTQRQLDSLKSEIFGYVSHTFMDLGFVPARAWVVNCQGRVGRPFSLCRREPQFVKDFPQRGQTDFGKIGFENRIARRAGEDKLRAAPFRSTESGTCSRS